MASDDDDCRLSWKDKGPGDITPTATHLENKHYSRNHPLIINPRGPRQRLNAHLRGIWYSLKGLTSCEFIRKRWQGTRCQPDPSGGTKRYSHLL